MKRLITKNGYMITQILSGRSNAFLVSGNDSNILVDTGPGFLWKKLNKRLDKLGISKIEAVVLTHCHFDHSGNAGKIREKYSAKVLIHSLEAVLLERGDNIPPEGTNRFTRYILRVFGKQFESFAHYEPCRCDITADSKPDLSEYGVKAVVLHTPGHTPGSVSVIVDDEIALTGDTMFGIFPWSVFPPFASDAETLVQSWGELLKTGCRLFIPSHGTQNSRALVEKDYRKRFCQQS